MLSNAQGRTTRTRSHPSTAEDQRRTVDFLASSLTHCGATVERIDTHISHIFLTSDRAYKLKRAIRTNFLDFSTIAGRKAACRREIEVNADVASGIYRGVIPVVRRDGALALGGAGEVVDWVVEMNRFDRAQELDALAETGRLDAGLVDTLADVVAEMHAHAPRTPDYGGAGRVAATIRQISEAIATSPSSGVLNGPLGIWRSRAEEALATHAPRLDTRRRHGYVRRCHGDLHLGNICMFEGRPTPFDALEFNEEMASTDVLYDIAFVLMDLIERDLRPLANTFLNRYLSATRDYSGLALLPLFVSMRAAVRALVAASREAADPNEPSAMERLLFAGKALAPGEAPKLIAIGGLSGSGKSTVARQVAPELGAATILLRSDVARKRMFSVAPEAALPETAYQPDISARVYARLRKDAHRALASRSNVILDATYISLADRRLAERIAERAEVDFVGIWLTCEAAELRRRISARGEDASDATVDVLSKQLAHDPGAGAWVAVPSGADLQTTVAEVLRAVHGREATSSRSFA